MGSGIANLNAVLLEENPKSHIVVFYLQSCEFTENCGTGLVGELVGAFDLFLLGLQLLLESLDFSLNGLDFRILCLAGLLQFAVSDSLENNRSGQDQGQGRCESQRDF